MTDSTPPRTLRDEIEQVITSNWPVAFASAQARSIEARLLAEKLLAQFDIRPHNEPAPRDREEALAVAELFFAHEGALEDVVHAFVARGWLVGPRVPEGMTAEKLRSIADWIESGDNNYPEEGPVDFGLMVVDLCAWADILAARDVVDELPSRGDEMSAEREQLRRLIAAMPGDDRGLGPRVDPRDAGVFAQLMMAEGLHRVADALERGDSPAEPKETR